MTNKTIAEAAIDTRLLIALLSKAEVGQTVSYAEMAAQLSRPMEGADSYLQSALRMVERDFGMVFNVIRGEGYKRLNDSEIVALGGRLPIRIRRIARRTVRTISKANEANLTNAERIQRNATTSMAGVLAHVATEKSMRKLEAAVQEGGSQELPVGRTLELFKSKAS